MLMYRKERSVLEDIVEIERLISETSFTEFSGY
jgi:hypothetical protein